MTREDRAEMKGVSGMDRTMVVLLALVFVDTLGYALVLPLLPFFVRRYGLSVTLIGAVFATYSLCQLVWAPLLGRLSDRRGRRPLLIASQCGSAVGFLLLAISTSVWMILLSRVVDGITAGNIGVANAVVLDRYSREEWGARFAQLGSAVGVGILVGLSGSSVLASLGVPAAALAALALTVININLTWWMLPETRGNRQPEAARPWRSLWMPGASRLRRTVSGGLVSMTAQSAFLLALPLYFATVLRLGAQSSTIFITFIIAFGAIAQVTVVPRAFRVLGELRSVICGFGLVFLGSVVAAGAANLKLVALAGLIAVCGIVILNPGFTALLGKCNDMLGEGVLMGINQSMSSAGQLLGPPIGYLALGLGRGAGFGVACACLAAFGGAVTMTIGGGHG